MTQPPFVNLDAQWLADLAARSVIALPDVEIARLLLIAQHLESLDERVRNLSSFEEGVAEGLRRAYSRSNLPVQANGSISPELAEMIARTPVRKVVKQPNRGPKPPKVNEALRDLNIVIDLSKIGV